MRGCAPKVGPPTPWAARGPVSLLRQECQLQHLHPCRAGRFINAEPPPASEDVCFLLAAVRAHASHASAVALGAAAAAAAAAVRRDAGAPTARSCACCRLFPLTSKDHKVIIWQAGRPLAQLPHLQATHSLSCLGSCLPRMQASQNACNSAHQLPIGPPAAHHHGCCKS